MLENPILHNYQNTAVCKGSSAVQWPSVTYCAETSTVLTY